MIITYPHSTLGHANHGWLDTRYHFSFADYYNKLRMNFGVLRVINDDTIMPGEGFPTHPHHDMEIITYVREGAITHRDSMGNEGRTEAGDVQVMSAGTGVAHSEYNLEKIPTTLYQIWILPSKKGAPPRWEAQQFPKEPVKNKLHLLVSGRKEDEENSALFINQDAAIYGGNLKEGTSITHNIKYQAYILVAEGSVLINDCLVSQGDGAEVTDKKQIQIKAETDAEILVIDVPPLN